MKRDQMITRLVEGMGHNPRELRNKSNANIRAIYDQCKPIMERRAKRIAKIARREQRRIDEHKKSIAKIQAQIRDMEAQARWMRRCVKVPIKPIEAPFIRPVLNFGLAAFVTYAKQQFRYHGDLNAAATLRFLGAEAINRPPVIQGRFIELVQEAT